MEVLLYCHLHHFNHPLNIWRIYSWGLNLTTQKYISKPQGSNLTASYYFLPGHFIREITALHRLLAAVNGVHSLCVTQCSVRYLTFQSIQCFIPATDGAHWWRWWMSRRSIQYVACGPTCLQSPTASIDSSDFFLVCFLNYVRRRTAGLWRCCSVRWGIWAKTAEWMVQAAYQHRTKTKTKLQGSPVWSNALNSR